MEPSEIKQQIEKAIAKTERLIRDYKEMTRPVSPDDAIGRVSRMDAINNQSVTEASLRKAEEKLKNLNHVLLKVGTEEFGRCVKCQGPIPVGRILIRPESLYCIKCAD
jgi:DnaK suppressor protein